MVVIVSMSGVLFLVIIKIFFGCLVFKMVKVLLLSCRLLLNLSFRWIFVDLCLLLKIFMRLKLKFLFLFVGIWMCVVFYCCLLIYRISFVLVLKFVEFWIWVNVLYWLVMLVFFLVENIMILRLLGFMMFLIGMYLGCRFLRLNFGMFFMFLFENRYSVVGSVLVIWMLLIFFVLFVCLGLVSFVVVCKVFLRMFVCWVVLIWFSFFFRMDWLFVNFCIIFVLLEKLMIIVMFLFVIWLISLIVLCFVNLMWGLFLLVVIMFVDVLIRIIICLLSGLDVC